MFSSGRIWTFGSIAASHLLALYLRRVFKLVALSLPRSVRDDRDCRLGHGICRMAVISPRILQKRLVVEPIYRLGLGLCSSPPHVDGNSMVLRSGVARAG